MSASPVFLAGTDRSGIGLVGEILDAHPHLAISRRTNFWRFYHQRFGDLAEQDNLERCVEAMLAYTRMRALVTDREALLTEVRRSQPTYGRLFEAVQHQHLRARGKRRWGDKSLNAEGMADAIFAEFPDAMVLHVLRDPRDRYASQATHRRRSRGRVAAGVDLWLWSARLAQRNRRRYTGRYLVLRYEDLVAHPEDTITRICRFIGEPVAPEMLPASPEAGLSPSGQHWPRPISTASVGRYRRDLSESQVAFIERVARRSMAELGYPPTVTAAGSRGRVRTVALDVGPRLPALGAARVHRLFADRATAQPADRRLDSPTAGSAEQGR